MAGVVFTPAGKLKIVKKGADAVEDTAKGTRRGKEVIECPREVAGDSFPAGTLVLMGDGTTRPIEQIGVGDQVVATDPGTGVTGPRRVDATIYTPDDRHFTGITLDQGNGGGSLTATGHHPFWSENDKKWKNAADLTSEDSLRTLDGGTVQINDVRHWTGLAPAYNLTVNGLHTYYVLAGETPVLVHNSGGYTPPPSDKKLPGFPDAKYVGKGSPKSGGGYRARWSLPDGRILEWDSAHGTIEMWTNGKKNAKHMGEFDPTSGDQLPWQ
ncbi:colicin E3/pyocin S6 family cytotoxin [Streptomyces wuyuanensis]|uniref:colicin E3/pyocin S6 family cytotoxin n=1 Tax=Streptomyces wuyuanensis TaxID=1196353 RepID=UPI003446B974